MRLFVFFCCLPFFAAAQPAPLEIPLWEQGAPGFENRKNEQPETKDYWMKNIHQPTLTVYPADPVKASGAAIIICPGGGHRLLVYNAEGHDPAVFLSQLGVTVFVLKYRLAREENSPYTLEQHVKQDAYRAVRLVRSRADEFRIDRSRIGMMGFSAGGEVVAMVAYESGDGVSTASDPVDRENGRPNFQVLIYPGPLFIPSTVPADAPPAFLLAANDDACCSEPVLLLANRYRNAQASVELHLLAQGKHGFNMGYRSGLHVVKDWPQRLADWLHDQHIIP